MDYEVHSNAVKRDIAAPNAHTILHLHFNKNLGGALLDWQLFVATKILRLSYLQASVKIYLPL